MSSETEIKIKLESEQSAEVLIRKCSVLSHSAPERQTELDEYFDTENEELKKNDLVIRIRTSNGKSLVALKSPRVFITQFIQKRIELEFEVSDIHQVKSELEKQGLKASAIIEKRRWGFHLLGCHVVIDNLPFIGWFVEIEGNSPTDIDYCIVKLGLSRRSHVRQNYGELLDEKLKQLGLPIRPNLHATFADEMIWSQVKKRPKR